jgi:hypothetical protein
MGRECFIAIACCKFYEALEWKERVVGKTGYAG